MLKKLLFVIPVLAIFLLALAFGAQNADETVVNFLVFNATLSVAAVAGIFLAVGFFVSLFFYLASTVRWKLRYRRLLKKFDKLQQQTDAHSERAVTKD